MALTFKPLSNPYFIQPGEKASKYVIKYLIYSLLFGWWGLPWGPAYTVDRIRINFKNGGGVNITNEVMSKIEENHRERKADLPFENDIIITYDTGEQTTATRERNS